MFFLALQMMPLADQRRVVLGIVARDEAVAIEQPVPPPAHRIQLRGAPSFGLVPQEGMMRITVLLPGQRGQAPRGALQRAGPLVVAHRVVPAFGGDGIQVLPRAAAAVGVEVIVHSFPLGAVVLQPRQELIAASLGPPTWLSQSSGPTHSVCHESARSPL